MVTILNVIAVAAAVVGAGAIVVLLLSHND